MLFPKTHTHHSLAMALLMGLLLSLLAFVFQPPLPASAADPVIAGAGDIACDPANTNYNGGNGTTNNCRMKATSDLLVNMNLSGVFILGDNQMEDGAYAKYLQSYDPTWGRVKAITHPAVGNHDYLTTDAAGYYTYFGAAAGDPAKGYYSYDMGAWHVIVLNSNCGHAGGCSAGSPQEVWLKGDLAKNPNKCILSYWHYPRFSSGEWSNHPEYDAFWQDLYAAHADVTMHGHDHHYERFALQNPSQQADPMGIREFIAGTGGNNHTPWTTVQPNSQVRNNDTYGVLKLTLHATSYDWQFVPEAGKTFTDSGTTACHNTSAGAATPTSTTVSGGTDPLTFNPVADTYVDSANPSTNYGTATQLRVDGSLVVRSYLRFNVSGLTGPVTQATLRIYANSAQSTGYGVYRLSDNTWSETGLTYSNAPTLGTLIRSSGAATAGTWVSVDVTPYITWNGTWSLALATSSSTALSLASREAANKPQLLLTVGPSGAPSFTPTSVAPSPTPTPVSLATSTPTSTMVPTNTPAPNTATPTATRTSTIVVANTPTRTPTLTSTPGTLTFVPVADSYVDSANTSTNYGTSTQIRIDGSPIVRSYLRFNVTGLTGAVAKATLRVYANSSASTGGQARGVANNSWGETTISYSNAPAPSSTVTGTTGAFSTGAWATVDITPLITGNGTFSIALTTTGSTAVSLGSRESGSHAAQLVITTK